MGREHALGNIALSDIAERVCSPVCSLLPLRGSALTLALRTCRQFAVLIRKLHLFAQTHTPAETLAYVLMESGYARHAQACPFSDKQS